MIGAAEFRQIVRTVQQEYAGAEELKNPEVGQVFSSLIGMTEEMGLLEEEMLFNLIHVYLTVQGVHKVRFRASGRGQSRMYCRGFRARGSGEELYVSEAGREDRLRAGDRILTINGDAPMAYRAKLSQRTAPVPISDRDEWDAFLNYADHIEVRRADGQRETLTLRRFPENGEGSAGAAEGIYAPAAGTNAGTPVRTLRRFGNGKLYVRCDAPDGTPEAEQFLRRYRAEAAAPETEKIILDLRTLRGEGLEAYRTFAETVIPTSMPADEFWGQRGLLVRYSETNTDRLTENLERMKAELPSAEAELTAYLEAMLADARAKRGRGLVPEADEDAEEAPYTTLPGGPKQIVLLTDAETSGDAEWFAERVQRFEHVTVLGRETSGDFRYDYPVVLRFFKGVELTYPIARTAAVQAAGECRGVMPDVEIPWTPEETVRDVLLARALEL